MVSTTDMFRLGHDSSFRRGLGQHLNFIRALPTTRLGPADLSETLCAVEMMEVRNFALAFDPVANT